MQVISKTRNALILMCLLLSGCGGSGGTGTSGISGSATWSSTVSAALQDPLWQSRDASDASFNLMLPLHWAFEHGSDIHRQQFAEHFTRFLAEPDPFDGVSDLSRLEYDALLSRFLCLCAQHSKLDLIPAGLPQLVSDEAKRLWTDTPAWMWDTSPFPGGVKEKIAWKLAQGPTSPSYYRGIGSDELFLLGIGADLRQYHRLTGDLSAGQAMFDEIFQAAYDVFQDRSDLTPGGGFLFDTGVWTDHPDYAYTGHTALGPSLSPLSHPDAAWDTSHFHRMPFWLMCFSEGADPSSAEQAYFNSLRSRLAWQLLHVITVPPDGSFDGYRFTNFVDGWNGLYRYGYGVLSDGELGIGPYRLSGTVFYGWWSFLDNPDVTALYSSLLDEYPLTQAEIDLYTDPSTRVKNPLFQGAGYWQSGFPRLLVELAAQ